MIVAPNFRRLNVIGGFSMATVAGYSLDSSAGTGGAFINFVNGSGASTAETAVFANALGSVTVTLNSSNAATAAIAVITLSAALSGIGLYVSETGAGNILFRSTASFTVSETGFTAATGTGTGNLFGGVQSLPITVSTAGLIPVLSSGLLFAQGTPWLPTSPPSVPALPASVFRYLAYNSSAGLYWTTNPNGINTDDAVIGWAESNATDIIAISNQSIATAADAGGTAPATTAGTTGGGGAGVPSSLTAASGVTFTVYFQD